MFQIGSKLIVCASGAKSEQGQEAVVENETPLKLAFSDGDASAFQESEDGKAAIVDLYDEEGEELLMTAKVTATDGDGIELASLGDIETRSFVRVNGWLDLAYRVVEDEEEDFEMKEEPAADFGEALPQMDRLRMRELAQTDEASEAMLYLIQAVQTIDKKLETIAGILAKQAKPPAEEKPKFSKMKRRKVNISGSGVRFEADTELQKDQRLALKIQLPLRYPVEIYALGEVVRCESIDAGEEGSMRYSLACRFVQIREAEREHIVSYALQKQREALRRMRSRADGF